MSAHAESATSPAPCACTNISLMQLFHELKQKFPGVPDHVVSNTIEQYCHDKSACERHLHSEAKASLTHAYHASSSAAARQLHELKVQVPLKCPNQLIVKNEALNPITVTSVTCKSPQIAISSQSLSQEQIEDDQPLISKDAIINVVGDEKDIKVNENNNNITSPVTVINIDNCIAKYTAESPSDLELTNASVTGSEETPQEVSEPEHQGIVNYRILKSNKIRSCLNEKLEKGKEKKTIKKQETISVPSQKKDEQKSPSPQPQNKEKPIRPNTLEFLKPSPGIAFKDPLREPPEDPSKAISPAPPLKREPQETTPGGSYWPGNYPLNLSVNVNCHMDYAPRPYDPWLEDYDSTRAVTSVNLTVCTPTSNMASPVQEARDENGGFEGHVTVTVSPSTSRPPRRRAPPPPSPPSPPQPQSESLRSARSNVESSHELCLIARQRQRLARLAAALAQERARLAQLQRERAILRAPPAPPAAALALRDQVRRLRSQCGQLARRLELAGGEPESTEFYRNIYTGQRASARPARPAPPPPPPDDAPTWECGVCTFRNHGLLDKCEACEMPHIVIGTSPATTLDSGFGSFRDRERRIPPEATLVTEVADRPASRACV